METTGLLFLVFACVLFAASRSSHPPLLGVHPLDEKYYGSEVIKCKDDSKSFSKDRLNDNFCDCADGTDEPGTSACPSGQFYCKNVGSIPRFLFSSRVNDLFCDCCDGSDEYDGSIYCPNTCVMGGNVEYRTGNYISITSDLSSAGSKATKSRVDLENPIDNIAALKVATILQVGLVAFVVVFWSYRWCTRSKRRRFYVIVEAAPEMVIGATKLCRSLFHFRLLLIQCPSIRSMSSLQELENTIKVAVEAKNYEKIPDLLIPLGSCQNPNPFSFFSTFPQNVRTQIIDEMLQSFIPVRPRSKPQITYTCLLSYTLQSSQPLPLALAILQRILRSGCVPVPQTHVLLSSAWLDCRRQSHSVSNLLLEMQTIGYYPDCGTCNYLLLSLCAVDQLVEAVRVLKGMGGSGCVPDVESYGTVIGAICRVRRTAEALELIKQMVVTVRLTPGQGTVVKLAAAFRANREIWKAVETIEFLEREGCSVGFESYEVVVEGCLERQEYILAGKVVMGMTERGFIPYIRVRQKIVDGLASVGAWKLACAVRQRFSELRS